MSGGGGGNASGREYTWRMANLDFVSEAEYLSASYEPDCDLVEGQFVERSTGSVAHADCLGRILVALMTVRDCWVAPVLTLHVGKARYRVADIVLARGVKPKSRWMEAPPDLVVEVLEPEEDMKAMQAKIYDYLQFGVSCAWVVDPTARRGFVFGRQRRTDALDGKLRASGLEVDLQEIFLAQ